MSVVRDQEQGRLAVLRGLISQSQLDWAWDQEFSRSDADLCQHLVDLDLISADDAEDIRLTLDDPPAAPPSALERVVDELASQFADSDSSSERTPAEPFGDADPFGLDLSDPLENGEEPDSAEIFRDVSEPASGLFKADPESDSSLRVNFASKEGEAEPPTIDVADLVTYAHAREAYERACEVEELFAPHAERQLERGETLGEGGMGVVYRVRDLRLGREAAMKVVRANVADPDALARFEREARITAALDHPAIPPVFELGITPSGERYMLMRLIAGETLSTRIERFQKKGGKNPHKLRELLEVLVKVGEAVAYAHERGILHRDLKPENVMVGQFGEVLVMDWGLARDLHGEVTDASESTLRAFSDVVSEEALSSEGVTLRGTIIGTPGYMAPEQADGLEVDERADVFALGAILTEILTGDPPVLARSKITRVTATLQGYIDVPWDRRRDVPFELNALAERALEPDAEQRLASAALFVSELKSWLAGRPLQSIDYPLYERARVLVKAHTSLLIGALAATLLVSLISLLWVSAQQASERAAMAQDESERALAAEKRAIEKRRTQLAILAELAMARALAGRGAAVQEVERHARKAVELGEGTLSIYLAAAEVAKDPRYRHIGLDLLLEGAERNPPGVEALFQRYLLEQLMAGWDWGDSSPASDAEPESLTLLTRCPKEELPGPLRAFLEGEAAYQDGEFDKALACYDRAELGNKGIARLYERRASIHVRSGRFSQAEDDFARALAIQPGASRVWLARARNAVVAGDKINALRFFEHAQRRSHTELEANLIELGALAFDVGQESPDEARRALAVLTPQLLEHRTWWRLRFQRAHLALLVDHFLEALNDCEVVELSEARSPDPEVRARLPVIRALAMVGLGRVDEARAQLTAMKLIDETCRRLIARRAPGLLKARGAGPVKDEEDP